MNRHRPVSSRRSPSATTMAAGCDRTAASSVGETTNSGRRVRHNNLTPLQQPLVAQAPNWNRSPKIIQRESSESTKFELFQRLNTGGSALSDQEVRNA